MAKQKSLLKVGGSLEDLNFFKRDGQHFVRMRSSLNAQRIASDASFARTREVNQEFTSVMKVAKLLRAAFRSNMMKVADPKFRRRLTSVLFRIKALDTTGLRGERTVAGGLENPEGVRLLTGFNFNGGVNLIDVLAEKPQVDTETGSIALWGINPLEMDHVPPSATHFSLSSAWARIDMVNDAEDVVVTETGILPLTPGAQDIILAPQQQPQGEGRDLFALMVRFYEVTGGVAYPLGSNTQQAAAIVAVA